MRKSYVECTYSLAVLIMSLLSDMYPWLSLTLTLTIISLFFTRQLLAPESKQQNCQHLHVSLGLIPDYPQMPNMKQSIHSRLRSHVNSMQPYFRVYLQGRRGHRGNKNYILSHCTKFNMSISILFSSKTSCSMLLTLCNKNEILTNIEMPHQLFSKTNPMSYHAP